MICPFCGKLGHDSHTFCLYCGATFIYPSSLSPDSLVPDSVCTDTDQTRVYEIDDITGYEWCCSIESDSGTRNLCEGGGIPVGIHDMSALTGVEWRSQAVVSQDRKLSNGHTPAPFIGAGTTALSEETSLMTSVIRTPDVLSESAPHPSESAVENRRLKSSVSPKPPVHSSSEEDILRAALDDRYLIIRKIGTGGMASVYLAREIALDREVAIKVLPRVYLSDEQFIARFTREARLSAMLEHPHIVRIYSIGEDTTPCYFVMNYIPGGTISDRMKHGRPLNPNNISRWGADVCSALAYAHEHGVIHRDLKPDNIMLDRRNRAIVTDFGIAHAVRGTCLTQTGAVIGTPQYMSPDQACGKPPDARSDIYSFGIVLYQMATGVLPFKANDPMAVMYMHVHKTPPPPEIHNPDIPKWLRDCILRCIAKNPSDRFPNAAVLRRALIEKDMYQSNYESFKQERDRSIHNFFGAAMHIVSSAVPGLRGKESRVSPKNHLVEIRESIRSRHSLKLPRNITSS